MAAPVLAGDRWVWCPTDKKRAWLTEADAETARVQLADADRMNTYPCEVRRGRWHVGHTPGSSIDRPGDES